MLQSITYMLLFSRTSSLLVVYRHLILFQAMRKEFAQARVLALAQREVLYEVHELNVATTRLRLRYPGEIIPNISVLHPEQVPQQNVRLTGEKFSAVEELKRAKGQLRYLNVSPSVINIFSLC